MSDLLVVGFTGEDTADHMLNNLAAHGAIASRCCPRRRRLTRDDRQEMTKRFQTWREITGTAMVM